MMHGIDVSAAHGVVDWSRVAASGIQFAYIEAQIGNDGKAARFDANRAGAQAAGLACGAYMFAYPLPFDMAHPGRDPGSQARAFFAASGGLGMNPGDLPPCIDIEYPVQSDWAKWACSAASIRDWTLECIDAVHSLFGRAPILYSFPDFVRSVGFASDARFAASSLWFASYPGAYQHEWPDDVGEFPTIAPWARSDVWQFSSTMAIPGIIGRVDGDVIRGEDFAALTRGRTTLPPEAA